MRFTLELMRCLDGASAYWAGVRNELERAQMRAQLSVVKGGKSGR
jgi:hypothetical protein